MMSFASRRVTLRASLSIAAAMGLSLGVAMSSAQAQQAPARHAPTRPAAPARSPAPAQPAPSQDGASAPASGPQVVQLKPSAEGADWTKQCGEDKNQKTETCFTVRDFSSDNGQPVLVVAYSELKGQQGSLHNVRFVLPFGLVLDSGVRFSVDRSGYVAGKFSVCMPNGCFAEVPLKDETVKAMKKGTNFNVTVRNVAGNEVVFVVPASGFGKTVDGPAIDPKVLDEQEKKFRQDLQDQSEKLKKDLESRGAGGMPAPAPTPPAPAPGAAPRK